MNPLRVVSTDTLQRDARRGRDALFPEEAEAMPEASERLLSEINTV
jgi:hypothetical protein